MKRVDDFDFDLPDDLIALEPARPRDASRLLHVGAHIFDRHFADLPALLRGGDALVLNNTKVLPAALTAIRPARAISGGGDVRVDINLHKALHPSAQEECRWAAFARPAKRLKADDALDFGAGLKAMVESRDHAEVILRFNQNNEEFIRLLKKTGHMPLPPYIGRQREFSETDNIDYQTIFAQAEGSVAAPTAGLHFTKEILTALQQQQVHIFFVTLHVGAGTFLPVSVENIAEHKMHAEYGEISKTTAQQINQVKQQGGRIIPVGTTSLRLLESASTKDGLVLPFADETDIFITPGYEFKCADALITNFHLPKSTLFMLVSAFSGFENMHQAYQHAIKQRYRFYSYGDACYLERYDQF
ncbi:MAG: tRNA preQ1(34) S-adenosylmethionine ribosyltransferase-isomerase QueA [bacterium]